MSDIMNRIPYASDIGSIACGIIFILAKIFQTPGVLWREKVKNWILLKWLSNYRGQSKVYQRLVTQGQLTPTLNVFIRIISWLYIFPLSDVVPYWHILKRVNSCSEVIVKMGIWEGGSCWINLCKIRKLNARRMFPKSWSPLECSVMFVVKSLWLCS